MTKASNLPPDMVMKSIIKAHHQGLPKSFEKLTEELGQLGKVTFNEDRVSELMETIHKLIDALPFEASLEVDLSFGLKTGDIPIDDWPHVLSTEDGNCLLVCGSDGKPYEGMSLFEMVEFDVVNDLNRVKEAVSWQHHKKRMEVGNLISFYPFPAQCEGHPSALTHDHALVLMCHRDAKNAETSDGSRGVAVLLDRHQQAEIAKYCRAQYDELMEMSDEEKAERRLETMDETYDAIGQLLTQMSIAGEAKVDEDLLNLKAWSPAGRPQ